MLATDDQMNTTEELLDEIRAGRMVVVMDDEDRENEGDLIMAAEKVRAEDINFMATHARGLICMPLTRQRCETLQLPLMVVGNGSPFGTNFTVSVEAADGVTTGISAADRACTIQAAVSANATADDLVRPGHVFPLMAQPGGVLARPGHTETAVDLARLAGLEPAGVLVEILNADGTMARRPELLAFARQHGLKIGTVADLIRHRLATEIVVERAAEKDVVIDGARFRLLVYRDLVGDSLQYALVRGVDEITPVAFHTRNTLSDIFGVETADAPVPLRTSIKRLSTMHTGVLVVLGADESEASLLTRLADTVELRPTRDDADGENRCAATVGIGGQILKDLGCGSIEVFFTSIAVDEWEQMGLDVVSSSMPARQCGNAH